MTMDKTLSFTLKDLITLVMLISSVLTVYYSLDTGIILLKNENTILKTEMIELKTEMKAYKDLPSQVNRLEKVTDEMFKMVSVIRDGLIAKRIIEPRSQ